ALRTDVESGLSFTELLQKVKSTTMAAYENQEVPFEKVVDAVVSERDVSRTPIFQTMFVLQNTPEAQQLKLGQVELLAEGVENMSAKFEVTLSITETAGGLIGGFEYNADLFTRDTIERITAHYQELIKSIVHSGTQRIGLLPMLAKKEEHQLLTEFNDTASDYPKDKSIAELFEDQVIKSPKAIAVLFEEEEMTYEELNARSNQFAHYLRDKGVKRETLVPICIERGLNMIVGLLGILKSGGAYVPIDPHYPVERIQNMLADTGACLVVSSSQNIANIPVTQGVSVIEIDNDWSEISKKPKDNLKTVIEGDDLVYVIYTSGSTGKPKGVMIENRSVVNLLVSIADKVQFGCDSIFLSVTTFSFDICYLELYMPLVYGGQLVIVPRHTAADGFKLAESVTRFSPTHMQGTPSTWQLLLDSGWQNNNKLKILIGGEAVSEDIKNELTKKGSVWNVYGPTETTIWSTIKHLRRDEKVSIGSPLANTEILILGNENELLPIGGVGQICIGGDGLARGYLNRSELTAEKFITHPHGRDKKARLYKTGDLGKWLQAGTIEYLGRIDEQVKIRGYRIELGEIESVLLQSGLVKQAVVVAKADGGETKRLVGYVISNGAFDRQQVMKYLQSKLPEYMVPALWVKLESLPLTANGKIDRKALPNPEAADLITNKYVTPENEVQIALAEIWQELLGVERIGIEDNFFELGGHSLLAMRMVAAIRKKMKVELPLKEVFVHPTIARLSNHFPSGKKAEVVLPPITPVHPRPEKIPLSFSQERLWFIDKLEGSRQYHIPVVLRLKGTVNTDVLELSLKTIVDRHEVLRTVFIEEDGQAFQQIKDRDHWQLRITDRSNSKEDRKEQQQYIRELISQRFDLAADDMLRAELIPLSDQEHLLVVILHHIAADGWSFSNVVSEVVALYNAIIEGRPPQLPVLPVQYADYAIWQRNYLQGQLLAEKISYWIGKLQDVEPLQLPTDYVRPALSTGKGALSNFLIDREVSSALRQLSQHEGVTLFMTLLAVFKVLLYRYTGQQDICVGTPVAGRQQQELEGLIGCFLNTVVLRDEVNVDLSFTQLLQHVGNSTMEAFGHQDVPFEKVVEAVVKERDMSRTPLFQVMFVLQNTPELPPLKLGDVRLTTESFEHTANKFDITVSISETAKGLAGSIQYNTDLYKSATIEKMIAHYQQLLSSVVHAPEQKVGLLKMLGKSEETQLLEAFNDTSIDFGQQKTIVDVFEEQVIKTPEATALVFEEDRLTYKQLNERANQIAHYLKSAGVTEETFVPICIERSLEMLVGLLGILKAGGVYVPIDPLYPVERIKYVITDTAAKIVVTSRKSSAALIGVEGVQTLVLGEGSADLSGRPVTNVERGIKPNNLVYVIYTSGSTGRPKGVMIEHRALMDHCYGVIKEASLKGCKSFALFAPLIFDAGHSIIHSSFILGAALYIISDKQLSEGSELVNYLGHHQVDCLKIVPSLWLSYADENEVILAGKVMIFGGEEFKVGIINRLAEVGYRGHVFNHYGPTEATIGKCIYKVDVDKPFTTVPIGKPFSNTSVYIVDKDTQLVPVGVPGQLYIGGEGLAREYLNEPELTAEKFIKDPFSEQPSARVYVTGDLCRWLPDGNIEYLGRIDDQIKIRGHRIEIGEVESVMLQSHLVKKALVVGREDARGNKQLVGYVVPEGDFNKEGVFAHLKNSLPGYMIPVILVELKHLPLTPNGKIDRKALPDP
ncbi:MAG: linear pentadecapeptide gramicidin synthetase LgrD, partial [Segetibacter sp.]|nr:linear pentadecapeptide gramicidin synthetase LgrD [Segetibacter sp.]